MEKEELEEIYKILEKNDKENLKNKLKLYLKRLKNNDLLVKENNEIGVTKDGFYYIK